MLQGLGLPLLWPQSFPTGPSEARGRSTHGGGELCLDRQPFAKTVLFPHIYLDLFKLWSWTFHRRAPGSGGT